MQFRIGKVVRITDPLSPSFRKEGVIEYRKFNELGTLFHVRVGQHLVKVHPQFLEDVVRLPAPPPPVRRL